MNDLEHCPKCGGPADNGHDRSIPPSPYYCTKCMAEVSMIAEEIDWSKLTLPASTFSFHAPPKPNWKISFGDSDTNLYFQFYGKNPPNRFQRWMIKKVLGVKWEPIL